MQLVSSQRSIWKLICCLLSQFFATIFSCTATRMPAVHQTGLEQPPKLQLQSQLQSRPRGQRQVSEYEKVELLHRMLVAQHLEQRRQLRLALLRRRLEFELAN